MTVSTGMSSFFFAWLVLGLAMGAGLYDRKRSRTDALASV